MENHTVYARSADVEVTANLTIKDFVQVMKTSKPGKHYDSDVFMVGATPMAIAVYPNGYNEENRGNVSVFLQNQGDASLTVKCQFITEAITWSFDHEVTAKRAWGSLRSLDHAQCEVTFKEKDFLLTANVRIPGEDLKIMGTEDPVAPKNFCVALCRNLYDKMLDPNFALIFNGAEVPCHKNVLAAASPVFEAMVVNQHQEAIESKANIELSEEVGRAFVKYLYTGELDEDLLKEHTVAFLELGNYYIVHELKDLAEKEMLKQLDKKVMVKFLSIGDLFNANKIFEAALKMAKANMAWLRTQVCDK